MKTRTEKIMDGIFFTATAIFIATGLYSCIPRDGTLSYGAEPKAKWYAPEGLPGDLFFTPSKPID